MTGAGEGRPGDSAGGEAPERSRGGRGAPDGGRPVAPDDATVAGLGPLLRICVVAVGAALLAAVVPWSGADAAARAGVGVLLSAPYLATLSAAVHYARERRWPEAALALLLLLLLLAGLWLGTGRTP